MPITQWVRVFLFCVAVGAASTPISAANSQATAAQVEDPYADDDRVQAARIMGAKALGFYQNSQFNEAGEAAAQAFAMFRARLGERHTETMTALHNYAAILYAAGRSAEAEPLMAQTMRLRREELGESHPLTMGSINTYSNILLALGRIEESLPYAQEALRLRRKVFGKNHPVALDSLNDYGLKLWSLGRTREALPLVREALQLRREALGNDHPSVATSLSSVAVVLEDLGRSLEAEPYVAEALRLTRKSYGPRHPETIKKLNNYAASLQRIGRAEAASPAGAEALKLARDVLGHDHPDTLAYALNYALNLGDLGRFGEAEGLVAQALNRAQASLGADHPLSMTVESVYALFLQKLGNKDEAAIRFGDVVERLNAKLGASHPRTIEAQRDYGALLIEMGRARQAETLLTRSLAVTREVLGDRHPETLYALGLSARIALDTGEPERALALSSKLVGIGRARATELGDGGLRGGLQESLEIGTRQATEKLHANALWVSGYGSEVDIADSLARAFTALQLASTTGTNRAVVEAAASRFASAEGQSEIVLERRQLVNEWPAAETALVKAQAGGEATATNRRFLRQRLADIERRIEEIDQVLAREAPQFFAILDHDAVTLGDLRAVLREEEAVLLMVPTPRGTHTLAVTRETLKWARSSLTSDGLADAVKDFRLGLEIQPGDEFLPDFDFDLSEQLYRDLIAPVEGALMGKSRVYVVAAGALSRFPLGTLTTRPLAEGADPSDSAVMRNADWLADRYALVQLPSLQSLVYVRSFGGASDNRNKAGFTGFGAPVLEGGARLRGARSATLDPVEATDLIGGYRRVTGLPLMSPSELRKLAALPGTQSELEQVRSALGAPQNSLFLRERMTEAAIRQADLSSTQILHLATHGFTSEEANTLAEPGLVFTPPEEASAGNDGYLAASEVVGLDLTLAQWVILSACNTASPSGKPGETGLSGLAQAFLYAGAESLLVSHWPVFDDIAPLLTVETLKRFQSGQPRAEAFQAAMQKVRDDVELDAAHPAVWAPFILVGEGR